jgi:hypothetical protein
MAVSAAAVIAADWPFAQLFATKKLDSGPQDNYHNRSPIGIIAGRLNEEGTARFCWTVPSFLR